MRGLRWAAIAAFTLGAGPLCASAITFTLGSPRTTLPNRTLGYSFSTPGGLTRITALGYYDHFGDGLLTSHQVAIWSADGSTILASAVIPAGTSAPLTSQFRFVEIAPVYLPAGREYLIGGFTGTNTDAVIRLANASIIHGLTLGAPHFDPVPLAGVFTAPTSFETTFKDGYFGPSFKATVVPEPATFGTVGLCLLCLGVIRKRRAGAIRKFARKSLWRGPPQSVPSSAGVPIHRHAATVRDGT